VTGFLIDEDGRLIDKDGFLIDAAGHQFLQSGSPILGAPAQRVSGGTLATGAGGTISVTSTADAWLYGMVGKVYTLANAPAVDTTVVNVTATAGDVDVYDLVNATQAITIQGANVNVLGKALV